MKTLAVLLTLLSVVHAEEVENQVTQLFYSNEGQRIAASARLCELKNDREGYVTEIAKRRRYSSLGGVDDVTVLYDLQQSVRDSDDQIAEWKSRLRASKIKPIPCGNEVIKAIVSCNAATDSGACTGRIALLVQVLNRMTQEAQQ